LWTRSAGRRGTVGRQLSAAEVGKVRAEVARHAEFTAIAERIAEVSELLSADPGYRGPRVATSCRGGVGAAGTGKMPRGRDLWLYHR
jgi:hypothetical protein